MAINFDVIIEALKNQGITNPHYLGSEGQDHLFEGEHEGVLKRKWIKPGEPVNNQNWKSKDNEKWPDGVKFVNEK